jgi:2-succinyl-5-enolpyruvyl-6-hydroxy-3-cyclohexene-1-carboxylate synthase
MTGPVAADVQAAFCTVLVDEWARAGVTDAVVAPGSRSTPIVIALDGQPGIRVHVVLDERSAGFVALGLGLASGRPAVVATTSGTAAVELHPAVVEASHAGVPLIAVTADRPPELHDVGAPQTVEQTDLYGPAVRWATSPGVAEAAASGGWRSLASRCVAEAVSGPHGPGPVHCNLAFREPLLGSGSGSGRGRGSGSEGEGGSAVAVPPGRADGATWHSRLAASGGQVPGPVLDLLTAHAGGRGLIVAGAGAAGASVAGAGDPATLLDGARRLGWPVFADPRSGCRVPGEPVVAAADALLRIPEVAAWRPDVVLRLGAPWASKVLTQWLAGLGPEVPQVLVDPWGRWADPDRQVGEVVVGDPGQVVAALAASAGLVGRASGGPAGSARSVGSGSGAPARREMGGPGGGNSPGGTDSSGWARQWSEAERAAQSALDELLGPGGSLALSEPGVARAVVNGLPDGGVLLASSSMPVRDVEWYGEPREKLEVLANRGANGIDGILSTAIGVAAACGAPALALVGDLAFLYDAGALLGAARRDLALTVIVVDNNGGGIFSFLPQATALPAREFERYWGTPHNVDILAVAGAYGAETIEIGDRSHLDQVVERAGQPGLRVALVRSDRAGNVTAHDMLHDAVAAAVRRR